eukprot:gene9161-16289_t
MPTRELKRYLSNLFKKGMAGGQGGSLLGQQATYQATYHQLGRRAAGYVGQEEGLHGQHVTYQQVGQQLAAGYVGPKKALLRHKQPGGKKWSRVVDTNMAPPEDVTVEGNCGFDPIYGIEAFASILLIAK